MAYRFNPPPNWPVNEPGWTPPPGWQPDPSWGPAPDNWSFWVQEDAAPSTGSAPETSAPAPSGTELPAESSSAEAPSAPETELMTGSDRPVASDPDDAVADAAGADQPPAAPVRGADEPSTADREATDRIFDADLTQAMPASERPDAVRPEEEHPAAESHGADSQDAQPASAASASEHPAAPYEGAGSAGAAGAGAGAGWSDAGSAPAAPAADHAAGAPSVTDGSYGQGSAPSAPPQPSQPSPNGYGSPNGYASPAAYGSPNGYGSANGAGGGAGTGDGGGAGGGANQWSSVPGSGGEPPKKGFLARFWWLGCIALFLVAVLIAVIALAVFLNRGGDDEPTAEPATSTSASKDPSATPSETSTEASDGGDATAEPTIPAVLPTVDPAAQPVEVASSQGKGTMQVSMQWVSADQLEAAYGTIDPPTQGDQYLAVTSHLKVDEGTLSVNNFNYAVYTPYGGRIDSALVTYQLKDNGISNSDKTDINAGEEYTITILYDLPKNPGLKLQYDTWDNSYQWDVPV